MRCDRRAGLEEDPGYATLKARLQRLNEIFARIEDWTITKTKLEVMDILNKHRIPCGPVFSMKELAEDPALRASGAVVEVDHPVRGKHLTVGNPVKLSDSPSTVARCAFAWRTYARNPAGYPRHVRRSYRRPRSIRRDRQTLSLTALTGLIPGEG